MIHIHVTNYHASTTFPMISSSSSSFSSDLHPFGHYTWLWSQSSDSCESADESSQPVAHLDHSDTRWLRGSSSQCSLKLMIVKSCVFLPDISLWVPRIIIIFFIDGWRWRSEDPHHYHEDHSVLIIPHPFNRFLFAASSPLLFYWNFSFVGWHVVSGK